MRNSELKPLFKLMRQLISTIICMEENNLKNGSVQYSMQSKIDPFLSHKAKENAFLSEQFGELIF